MDEKIIDIKSDQDAMDTCLPVFGLSLTAMDVANINKAFLRYTQKRQDMLAKQAELQGIVEEMIHEHNTTQLVFDYIVMQKWIDMAIGSNHSFGKRCSTPNIIEQSTGKLAIVLDGNGGIQPTQLRGDVIGKEG